MPGLASVETDSENDFEVPVVDQDRRSMAGAAAAAPAAASAVPKPSASTSSTSSTSTRSSTDSRSKKTEPAKAKSVRPKEARRESPRNDPRPPSAASSSSSYMESSSSSKDRGQDDLQKKEQLRKQFRELLAEGSKSIQSEVSRSAVTAFEKALEFTKNYENDMLQHNEMDSVILRYCMGLAHVSSGIEANINNAITAFTEIAECEGKNYLFAFLGLGIAYRKFNYFNKAIPWLERGHEAVSKGVRITGRRSPWPGLGSGCLIEETDEVILKEKLSNLIFECKNPEPPEAKCGFDKCTEVKRDIYFTDIPFTGYIDLICKEKCKFSFHRNCWTKYKAEKNIKSNKEFLGKECPTPDCAAIIKEFISIDHTTSVKSREIYESPEETKTVVKKSKAKERAQPSAENLKRKMEKKAEKRRQKMAAKEMCEELAEGAIVAKEPEPEIELPPMEEMVQLKSKTDDDDLSKVPVKKKKHHKNKEKEVYFITYFVNLTS